MQNVVMLTVIYAEWHLFLVWQVSTICSKLYMLNVLMLNGVMLNGVETKNKLECVSLVSFVRVLYLQF